LLSPSLVGVSAVAELALALAGESHPAWLQQLQRGFLKLILS
jgi:hypothetical protein